MADNPVLVSLPVLLPLLGAAVAFLLGRWWRAQAVVAAAALLAATVAGAALLARTVPAGAAVVYQSGGWPAPYGITLVADPLSAILVVMSLVVLCAGWAYAVGSRETATRARAFAPLFLGLGAGLCGAFLTGDLFNFFVFAELVVICGTVLTALSDDEQGTEAALKYFYISLLASTFLLLACGALYVGYGTLNMADLAAGISQDPGAPLATFALVLLVAAFMVKGAAVPFHFWQPDFHTVSPTAVSAMLSSIVVKIGIYGFLRLTTLLFVPFAPDLQRLLLLLGAAGILYGGLAAAATYNAKRVLAYSTLAQLGFILVAIGWGTRGAIVAATVFAVNHSLIKAALLMLAGALASRAERKSADFAVVAGLGRGTPLLGALFLLGGVALAGIPPTAGFVSKLLLFQSGIGAERGVSLAVIAGSSALTLLYVTRTYQRLFWAPRADGLTAKPGGDRLLAPALLIAAVLVLGLWPGPLVTAAEAAADWLLQPAAYVAAVLGG